MFRSSCIGLLFILIIVQLVLAARLPIVGGDEDQWGTILNEFLNVTFDDLGFLEADVVNTPQLNGSSVTSPKIAASAINVTHLADGAIGLSSKILDGVVSGAKISANAINSSHLLDGSISAVDLSPSSVNTTHIFDSTIIGADIAPGVLNGTHFSNSTLNLSNTNVTVDSINASRFFLDLEVVTAECTGSLCQVSANCTTGRMVLFGFVSDNGLDCDSVPGQCNSFCQIGIANCSITAQVASLGASVYIVCGNVQ